MHQGPNGYLWVGTYFGLLRYDGHEFEKIIELEGTIEETSIYSISSTYKEIIALGNRKVFVIDKNTLEKKVIPFNTGKISKPKKIIALRNSLLIAAEDGLWQLNYGNNFFTNIHPRSPVTDIKAINTGKVIYSNSEGFWAYYPFNKKLVPIKYNSVSLIKHFWLNQKGNISWFEADNEFFTGSLKNNKIQTLQRFEVMIPAQSIGLEYYQNKHYLGTKNGLVAINNDGETELIQQETDDYFSLSQNFISCMLVDNINNFWVGTEIGGINLHNPNRYVFHLNSYLTSKKESKCKEVISFAETEKGEILVQTALKETGIYELKNKAFKKWVQTSIIANCISKKVGTTSQFYMGTPDGLYEFDYEKESKNFISTKSNFKTFESDIKSIIYTGNNQYWMGGSDGFFLFDGVLNKVIKHYGIANSEIGCENVRNINFKNRELILISTTKGLYQLNINTDKISLLPLSKDKNEPMVSVAITDKKGRTWIGTSGKGIYITNTNQLQLIIDKEKGLANNQIYTLTFNQDSSECWATTNKGISRISIENFGIKNYFVDDGLQGSEFIESSNLRTKNGWICLGGVAGFNSFEPTQIYESKNSSQMNIKSLSIFNEKQTFQEYYKIPGQQNYISFDYVALNFNLEKNLNYLYKLEGLDTSFHPVGNRKFVSFGQLSPGEYQFKVRAQNWNGDESSMEASVAFQIVPQIYQTLIFKIGSSIFLAAIIALVIYWRTQIAIQEEKEKGEQTAMIASLELKALRAQMNPHFIFNSLNSIQYFVMNNEGKIAAKYLSKFAKLIRMILDVSEQTFVSISNKIEFLQLYVDLEALRLNNSFNCEFVVDKNLDQNVLIPTLLIQPHVENAIWHGLQSKKGEKRLKIEFIHLSEDQVQVIVTDNGIGRTAAMEIKKQKIAVHQSRGSKISEDRIASLKKLFGSNPKIEIIDLYDENNLACGTKVIINVPIIHG
ncbi:MAG: histidine kinase [Bacteroidia bacterium]|nr:histidine kinase [Bacteroidia bacterium]